MGKVGVPRFVIILFRFLPDLRRRLARIRFVCPVFDTIGVAAYSLLKSLVKPRDWEPRRADRSRLPG